MSVCEDCGSHVAFHADMQRQRGPSHRPFGLPELQALQAQPMMTSEPPSNAARCPREIGSPSSEHLAHVFRERKRAHLKNARRGSSNDSKKNGFESSLVNPQGRRVRLSASQSSDGSTPALLQPRVQSRLHWQSKTLAEYFEKELKKKLQQKHPDGGCGEATPVSTEAQQCTLMSRRYSVARHTTHHLEATSLREPCESTPSLACDSVTESWVRKQDQDTLTARRICEFVAEPTCDTG